ncbi:MAG: hypothetical protein GKS06_07105 [Acidobacteria bacterium]|nr:hypothetical protein [Acidobacteriota bacterium]
MRNPNVMRVFSLVALPTLLLAVVSCSATGDIDDTSAPVQLILRSLTPVGANFGDVVSDDGTVSDNQIDATFVARLKRVTDTTAPALQEIVVERYEVEYRRTDGGAKVPAGMQRAITAKVQITPHGIVEETLTALTLTLIPGSQKLEPPLSHLISPGFEPDTGFVTIQADAIVTFYGRTIAGDPVSVTGQVGVQFANYGS